MHQVTTFILDYEVKKRIDSVKPRESVYKNRLPQDQEHMLDFLNFHVWDE
jgi:hypothetical protein